MVDTHTHYAHNRFDCGRSEIISGLSAVNVMAVIEGAIDFESNQNMKILCEKYDNVYMAAGCHPKCVEAMNEERFSELRKLTGYKKVIAVGETGLDYTDDKTELEIQTQKYWFEKFICLSLSVNKPLVIHCRPACEALTDILRKYDFSEKAGVIHSFNGNKELALELVDMGFYIGIGGILTKTEPGAALYEAVKSVPLERILFETDSPYLIPAKAAGKRNTSANLNYVAQVLAEIKNTDIKYVKKIVLQNTKRLYPQIFEDCVERIRHMEELFDELSECKEVSFADGGALLDKNIQVLSDYLLDGRWLNDFELDEQGLLPSDLKRGVLSQDGLYNLLNS